MRPPHPGQLSGQLSDTPRYSDPPLLYSDLQGFSSVSKDAR